MTRTKTSSTPKDTATGRHRPWVRWLSVGFIAMSMFALGVLVGRGNAPVQFDVDALKNELKTLKAEELKKDIQHYKIGPGSETHKVDLNFYEALKKSEDAEPPESSSEAASAPAAPAPASVDAAASTGEQGGEKEAGQKALTGTFLTLQVASMKDAAAADQMVAELNQNGFPAYRTEAVIPEKGRWYRVRVGRFDSRQDAAPLMHRLEARRFNPILIQQ